MSINMIRFDELIDAMIFLARDIPLKSTVVLLAAAVVAWMLRRRPSAARHAVWCSALVLLLVLPVLAYILPAWELAMLPRISAASVLTPTPDELDTMNVSTISEEREQVEADLSQSSEKSELSVVRGEGDNQFPAASCNPRSVVTEDQLVWPSLESLGGVAVLLWLIGVVLLGFGTVVRFAGSFRLLRGSLPLEDDEWAHSLVEIQRIRGIRRRISLLQNGSVDVPMTCGTFRPVVVIPSDFKGTPAEVRRILLHELAHIARFDVAWQLIGRIACAFYWFHPLAWWSLRRMREEQEHACDDWVLQAGERASDYADQLLAIARAKRRRMQLSTAIGMVQRTKLEKRIRLLLSNECSHGRLTRRGMLLFVFSGMIFTAAVAVARPVVRGSSETLPANILNQGTDDSAASRRQSAESSSTTKETSEKKPPAASEKPQSAESEKKPKGDYTVPITVSGRALNTEGKPIAGAKIYIADRRVNYKRFSETTSGTDGSFTLRDVSLPILRSEATNGRDHSMFVLYGEADGYGFAWRPDKWYYPEPNPSLRFLDRTDEDLPKFFQKDEKIELDLRFAKATTVRGRIVDDQGTPIPDTKLQIYDCELLPKVGYSVGTDDPPRRRFTIIDNNRFEMLNADVPERLRVRRTDSDGRFEFTSLPAGCRFRVRVAPPGFPDRMVWFATQGGLPEEYGEDRLYNGLEDVKVSFIRPTQIPIRVVYGDTGKPAPKVWVGLYNKEGESHKTSDENGRVLLGVPPGEYQLELLPEYKTPYLETESPFQVEAKPPASEVVVKIRPAAQVEIQVVDEETGLGIPGVDIWKKEGAGRSDYYTTSWEVDTRIVHRDRQRTDKDGFIHEFFEPGKYRIGVGYQYHAPFYTPADAEGQEFECRAGVKLNLVFEMRKVAKP